MSPAVLKAPMSMLPAAVMLVLVFMVPRIEQWLFPVVADFTITKLVKEPSHIVISGYMRKARDCRVLGLQAMAVDNFGREKEVPVAFLDRPHGGVSRHVGRQSWGPWQITVSVADAHEVRLLSSHRCHWVYSTESELATVPVKEY